jgi:hypothetical protein
MGQKIYLILEDLNGQKIYLILRRFKWAKNIFNFENINKKLLYLNIS